MSEPGQSDLSDVQVDIPGGLVITAGEQPLAVDAQRQARDLVGMPGQGQRVLAAVQVPYLDGFVFTAGEQPLAVDAQRQARHTAYVSKPGPSYFFQAIADIAV